MPDLSITEQVTIHASAPRVWRALTTPGELVEWYAPGCRWEIPSLAPGSLVRFHNSETDVQTAILEEAVPPRRLALRWQADAGDPTPSILNTFTLAAAGEGTTVTIRQAGYEALPEAVRGPWIDQDRAALAAIAASLKAYLERGATSGAAGAP